METQLVLPLEEPQTKDMILTSADDLPDEEWTEAEQTEVDQLDDLEGVSETATDEEFMWKAWSDEARAAAAEARKKGGSGEAENTQALFAHGVHAFQHKYGDMPSNKERAHITKSAKRMAASSSDINDGHMAMMEQHAQGAGYRSGRALVNAGPVPAPDEKQLAGMRWAGQYEKTKRTGRL